MEKGTPLFPPIQRYLKKTKKIIGDKNGGLRPIQASKVA
jgi:hypothetical protein